MMESMWRRLSCLTALVDAAPNKTLGRTALMKLLFLLTTIKDVPLGYRFRMYNYGPFDSEVLSDIDYAARLDALSVDMVRYVSGYEYYIRPGPAADEIIDRDKPFVDMHRKDIEWIIGNFASSSAGRLEMLSTIVYVKHKLEVSSTDDLIRVVNEIKPRFSEEMIRVDVDEFRKVGVLV